MGSEMCIRDSPLPLITVVDIQTPYAADANTGSVPAERITGLQRTMEAKVKRQFVVNSFGLDRQLLLSEDAWQPPVLQRRTTGEFSSDSA